VAASSATSAARRQQDARGRLAVARPVGDAACRRRDVARQHSPPHLFPVSASSASTWLPRAGRYITPPMTIGVTSGLLPVPASSDWRRIRAGAAPRAGAPSPAAGGPPPAPAARLRERSDHAGASARRSPRESRSAASSAVRTGCGCTSASRRTLRRRDCAAARAPDESDASERHPMEGGHLHPTPARSAGIR
jgi:hypothetical protein